MLDRLSTILNDTIQNDIHNHLQELKLVAKTYSKVEKSSKKQLYSKDCQLLLKNNIYSVGGRSLFYMMLQQKNIPCIEEYGEIFKDNDSYSNIHPLSVLTCRTHDETTLCIQIVSLLEIKSKIKPIEARKLPRRLTFEYRMWLTNNGYVKYTPILNRLNPLLNICWSAFSTYHSCNPFSFEKSHYVQLYEHIGTNAHKYNWLYNSLMLGFFVFRQDAKGLLGLPVFAAVHQMLYNPIHINCHGLGVIIGYLIATIEKKIDLDFTLQLIT